MNKFTISIFTLYIFNPYLPASTLHILFSNPLFSPNTQYAIDNKFWISYSDNILDSGSSLKLQLDIYNWTNQTSQVQYDWAQSIVLCPNSFIKINLSSSWMLSVNSNYHQFFAVPGADIKFTSHSFPFHLFWPHWYNLVLHDLRYSFLMPLPLSYWTLFHLIYLELSKMKIWLHAFFV